MKILLVAAILLGPLVALSGCASQSQQLKQEQLREERPFYQFEAESDTHGRKNWLDRLIEADPGQLNVEMASDYQQHPPATVAVMPFCDEGTGNFTVNKLPITFRNPEQQDQWAWTDAQRLRRAVAGYLAQREFTIINPIAVDAVLKSRGIDNMKKLRAASPIELGKLLGADALLYGQVNNYEGYYFGIVSAYDVGISTWMLSAHDGETLMRETGSRYSVDISPAFSPEDLLVNSAMTLLDFRDVTLARAEDEVSRELVLKIPQSQSLQQMAKAAVTRANAIEAEELEADLTPSLRRAVNSRSEVTLFTPVAFHRSAELDAR